ncbi:hypothetical protein CONLIGDRAFT_637731 [Coniochaeta ligniaria NRRL 30616]|uniref:Uncharacterized protein n=1 Tax=Coniochaeta ligniaria NRRL 30616 TaxID=1408157 RepID=A0A1J7I786_9PEZI|nr:hypothetical protein CONLIGDRAFT_637731 [Coniochaeta ligniaria NRRL 30616]
MSTSEESALSVGPVEEGDASVAPVTAALSDDARGERAARENTRELGNEIALSGEIVRVDVDLLGQGEHMMKPAGKDDAGPVHLAVAEVDGMGSEGVEIGERGGRQDGINTPVSDEKPRQDDDALVPDAHAAQDITWGGGTGIAAPPVRILVRCLSHKIPGPRSSRKFTMAGIICRHYFKRDYSPDVDKISVMGLEDIDGKKVRFLLESGTLTDTTAVDSVTSLAFKWTGEKLVSRDLDLRTRAYLRTLPFKHQPPGAATSTPSRRRSVEELRENMTDHEWNQYMQEFLKRRLQYEMVAGNLVKSWARDHPDLFFDVMQEYVAQKRWHKLVLTLAEEKWTEAKKDRDQPASFLSLMEVVLDRMGKDRAAGEVPASTVAGVKRTTGEMAEIPNAGT